MAAQQQEEGSYELMPYKDVVDLKRQIAELKVHQSEAPTKELLDSVNNLTKKMDSLVEIFKSTAQDLKLEEKEYGISAQLKPVVDKLESMMDQNKTIAEGMVALADIVNEFKEKHDKDSSTSNSKKESGNSKMESDNSVRSGSSRQSMPRIPPPPDFSIDNSVKGDKSSLLPPIGGPEMPRKGAMPPPSPEMNGSRGAPMPPPPQQQGRNFPPQGMPPPPNMGGQMSGMQYGRGSSPQGMPPPPPGDLGGPIGGQMPTPPGMPPMPGFDEHDTNTNSDSKKKGMFDGLFKKK